MKPIIKEILRRYISQSIIDRYHRNRDSIRNFPAVVRYIYDRFRYSIILCQLRRKVQKGPLNIIFLATYGQGWKYASLYRLMQKDPHFSPIVLVCPTVNRGHEKMLEVLDDTYEYFKVNGYNVVCAYDKKSENYLNISQFKPHIVVYTNPYKGLIDDRYYIDKIKKSLTFYVCYGVDINPFNWCYALELHQRVWRHFVGTQDDIGYAQKWSPWAISNRVVTGCPVYEMITQGSSSPKNWKNTDRKFKRIIYAPHHTIEGNTGLLHFSTFLEYGEFILELAKKYKDKVQFVFKPHPLLRFNLENHPAWGKERTDAYYRQWEEGENTNFVNGIYVDLFNSSDAMIHDCASFMYEYMCTQKPVLFLANSIDMGQYNKLGVALYENHYKANSKEELVKFIEDVVLGDKDPMKEKRIAIYDKYIFPPNGLTAAENMLNHLKQELKIID